MGLQNITFGIVLSLRAKKADPNPQGGTGLQVPHIIREHTMVEFMAAGVLVGLWTVAGVAMANALVRG